MSSIRDGVCGSKQKWRFTDQDDTNEKLESSNDLEDSKFVPKEDGGENNGDHRAGEHNTQGIGNCHVGHTAQCSCH